MIKRHKAIVLTLSMHTFLLSNHFLESCMSYQEKVFFLFFWVVFFCSSLGHSSIPDWFSSLIVQSTDYRQPKPRAVAEVSKASKATSHT